MTPSEAQNRVKASVWKALAQAEVNLSVLPREQQEALVEIVTNAALMEIDKEIGEELNIGRDTLVSPPAGDGNEDDEKVLWEGRPFLSVSTQYIITSERIRIIQGLLGKDREDIELIRIQDIDQSQTLRERLLNLGDITIRSQNASQPKTVLDNISNPQEVHELLRRAILNARKKYGLTYREEM
jgi:hypothetical protein